ncbi:hypothetical protein ACFORL_11330, partial [Legionella dresdenensis]
LAIHSNIVYAGGDFTNVGGQPRNRLAAIAAAAPGNLTAWNPDADSTVNALAIGNNSTVYAGGVFTTIGGQPRSRIAALDIAVPGAPTGWAPGANGPINSLAVGVDGTVYVGGNYTLIGGQARTRLAALNPDTGVPTAWNPAPIQAVLTITASSYAVYLGGNFSIIDAVRVGYFAMSLTELTL